MSRLHRETKPDFPECGCAGWGKPGMGGHSLHYMIAAVDRMNDHPVMIEVKAEPEDERNWVRQVPGEAVFARKGGMDSTDRQPGVAMIAAPG